jgi:serine/threonine protein kinase/Tol biopolymer transport system component
VIGQTLSHYRITAALGAGGMGEVYRATDTNLQREVAIKVLPSEVSQDPERLARFRREAHLLASLNHPNIAAIYGLEEADGKPFLALELVDGEDLAQRLKRGPLPVGEALELAGQIAEALDAAHEKGIVHRDLKPANVKVAPDGRVKVLDFGLAKAWVGDPTGSSGDLSQSPTLAHTGTAAGVILGTAAYMSPEQARGRPVDKRTDIWSFGCVLFEMLAGHSPVQGDTLTDVLAAIVSRAPDWGALPPTTPRGILTLLRRCLEKDTRRRLRDAADARLEIEEALHAPVGDPAAPPQPTRARWPWAAGGVAVGALLAGFAVWSLKPGAAPRHPAHLAIPLPSSGAFEGANGTLMLALSPDGRRVAYVGRSGSASQLFVRPLDRFEPQPIAGTEGAADPVFSPDGQWLAFFAASKLKKVAVAGGPVTTLAEAPDGIGISWGEDGAIVYCPDRWGRGLWRVPAGGGTAEALTRPDPKAGESVHALPHHLRGSDVLLFASFKGPSPANATLEALSLRTGKRTALVQGATQGRYLPPGRLVYASGDSLLVAPFDRARLAVTGPALPVLEGVLGNSTGGTAHFGLADDGTLAYVPAHTQSDERSLVVVNRDGVARPLTDARHPYEDMDLSPDGRRLALTIEGPTWGIWVLELARGTLTRLTLEHDNRDPHWTADSQRVSYSSFRNGRYGIYAKAADGSGAEEQLATSEYQQAPESWSPNGLEMTFSQWSPETTADIAVLSRAEGGPGQSRLLVSTRFSEGSSLFSPDGTWLAYASFESGRQEVYVMPYPGPGGRVQVSTDGGSRPIWAPDGRELYYRNGDQMMVVQVQRKPSFVAGTPRVLFEGRYWNAGQDYDVSPAGDRFYMIQEAPAPTEIRVVQDWLR